MPSDMTFMKWLALLFTLGLDTLALSIALGLANVPQRWRIALTFALAEALMPTVGYLLGHTVSLWLGTYGPWIGVVAVLGVGVWLLFENDDEDGLFHKGAAGWVLFLTALTISLDELAVGFSIGLGRLLAVPVGWTMLAMAVQAFLFTWLGLTFARRLKPFLGEAAEKAGGIILTLLGLYLGWELWQGS
ncbi:manganese efflux pump [Tumebacillus sp. DT12]|uniref:Manganese efflux pump n=1 Tax=Tumebacillus lacus TaxID=2995335 RepID=A0ABT3X5P4_9BACL|nr:manganese efflux pump [Tumebacillus lacus]MCX7572214.1 manganese efflux pump [Tumebacillus lacus]